MPWANKMSVLEGTYGIVQIKKTNVIKAAKRPFCDTFIKELYFCHLIPFAIKPIDMSINEYFKVVYPFAGFRLIEIAYKLSLDDKINAVFQLCSKVAWLHNNNILHNDLMTGNILYDMESKIVNIIDWGLSAFNKSQIYDIYTKYFKCPERKSGDIHSTDDDIYAIGCIILLIFSKSHIKAINTINKLSFNTLKLLGVPNKFRSIILDLLGPRLKRPSLSSILKHDVFNHLKSIKYPPMELDQTIPSIPAIKDGEAIYIKTINDFCDKCDALNVSPLVLNNAINIFHQYHTLKGLDVDILDDIINCCIVISNKILGIDRYCLEIKTSSVTIIDILKSIYPKYVMEPIINGTRNQIKEYYLNASSLGDISE